VPHSNRNFAIAYVLLVALPITGLIGVLRSGRNLKAPTSVDGVWRVQADATKVALSACVSALGLDPDTPVAISQSGKNFAISGVKAGGTGVIEGTTLHAALRPAGGPPSANCAGEGSVALTVTVDAKADPRVMSGVLSVAGCPLCEAVEFHAVRQASTQKKGAQ
jgi:hypothetical protein